MNESYKLNVVRKSTLKFTVFFALVGTMLIFVVPMITEKAQAFTNNHAKVSVGWSYVFSNVKWNLKQGEWVTHPHIVGHFKNDIKWATKGGGLFGGGTEFGYVEADLTAGARKAHAEFSWYNPSKGTNECGIKITGPDAWFFSGKAYCRISPGTYADAEYIIIR